MVQLKYGCGSSFCPILGWGSLLFGALFAFTPSLQLIMAESQEEVPSRKSSKVAVTRKHLRRDQAQEKRKGRHSIVNTDHIKERQVSIICVYNFDVFLLILVAKTKRRKGSKTRNIGQSSSTSVCIHSNQVGYGGWRSRRVYA